MWGEGKKVSKCAKVQKSVKLKRDVFLTENLLQLANFLGLYKGAIKQSRFTMRQVFRPDRKET